MAKEKVSIDTVIKKSQFKLKLSIKYLVLTEVSLLTILLVFLLKFDFLISCSIYFFIMLIYYKWFFHYNREAGQFKIFGIRLWDKFITKINKAYRERENV